jgi:putative ABC transport system permease protein
LHNVAQVVRNDNKALVGLSFMFLIVCLVNTIGMLLAKFLGKAPQIGIRRALGASKLAVFQQQLAEVSVIGFAGGLIGLGLARLGLSGAAYLYEAPEHLIYLDINMMITAVVIAVVASILAGLYPAWQVCRMPPAQYLKTQ